MKGSEVTNIKSPPGQSLGRLFKIGLKLLTWCFKILFKYMLPNDLEYPETIKVSIWMPGYKYLLTWDQCNWSNCLALLYVQHNPNLIHCILYRPNIPYRKSLN